MGGRKSGLRDGLEAEEGSFRFLALAFGWMVVAFY